MQALEGKNKPPTRTKQTKQTQTSSISSSQRLRCSSRCISLDMSSRSGRASSSSSSKALSRAKSFFKHLHSERVRNLQEEVISHPLYQREGRGGNQQANAPSLTPETVHIVYPFVFIGNTGAQVIKSLVLVLAAVTFGLSLIVSARVGGKKTEEEDEERK